MRVLHLLTSLGPGGAEIWLLDMLRAVDRRECAMDICLKGEEGPLAGTARELGASVFTARLTPTHVSYVRELSQILREGRYDIVHSHDYVYGGIGVWTARRMDIPSVCTFHHWHAPAQIPLLRKPGLKQLRDLYCAVSKGYSERYATYLTALSQKVLQHLDRGKHSEKWRLLSLSTGVPKVLSTAERIAVKKELGVAPDAPLILHIGRFIEQKNHDGVLDVFKRVLAEVPRAQLRLLGQGPLLDHVLQRISNEGLSHAVSYSGLRDDVPRILSAADLFLFPSRDEGFGLVALEANAAGLPVVGAAIPGLDEAVVNGETAHLHAVDDVDGMAQSVLSLLRDEEAARRLGQRGRQRVIEEYSNEAAAEKLLTLYRDCLAQRRS